MSEPNQNNQNSEVQRRHRPRKRRRFGVIGAVLKVIGTLCLIGIITCAILACFAAVYIKTIILPQADLKLTDYSMDLTSHMYYFDPDTGERRELQTLHGDENRVWVSLDEIPQDLQDAAVAIEDYTFWTNSGINWRRTAGAVVNMFFQMRDNFGGSTITQQLIKNVTGDDETTVKRKIVEIFRALEMTNNYEKDTILEWYLNYIYLGEKCNGVYTASYTYFGKHVSELTLAECAALIGITNNPSKYDPYLSLKTTDPETGETVTNKMRNKQRQETILYEMKDQGFITQEEYDEAVAQELVFARGTDESRPKVVYTWYEDQVINEVVADLMAAYDMSEKAALMVVYNSGLEIETCFNPKVQAAVDAVYENRENLDYTSATGQPLESAITIIDNRTGDVVAMAGGMGEKTASRLSNRASTAKRQPGSSIKPLAAYAPAIELGLINPSSVIDDAPINLEDAAWPRNSYDYYKGRMTVFEAVEDSSNPVAVRVMRDYITPQVAYDFLTGKLGFTTLILAQQGSDGTVFSDVDIAPLALGGLTKGVTTMEMASAYATFPRMGVYTSPRTYSRVYDSEGKLILENESVSSVAMKESTAFYINYMLKNVVEKGTGTQARIEGRTVAGKTGTTTNNYDRWFVGYTSQYTAAVWTGYDQNEKLKVTGNPAAQMWQKVMSRVHEGLENKEFGTPAEGTVTQKYCRDSGMLPNDYCPNDARGTRVVTGEFVNGDAPTQYCTLHVPVYLCKDDPILDEAGQPSGMYHLAGEFCPAESRVSVSVLDYVRNTEGVEYKTRDDHVLKANLEALGTCHVHLTAPEPEPPVYDPNDPTTWPGFDPENPGAATDPNAGTGGEPGWTWPWEEQPSASAEPEPSAEPGGAQAEDTGWHWPWENLLD